MNVPGTVLGAVETGAALRRAIGAVCDPELGEVTLDDLGLVRSVCMEQTDAGRRVTVELIPTFLGCPARSVIESDVRRAALGIAPGTVDVVWVNAVWRETSVTDGGRTKLAAIGVIVAGDGCPRCSAAVDVVLPNGAAACRSVGRCAGCGELIDVLRGPSSNVRFSHAHQRGSYAHL